MDLRSIVSGAISSINPHVPVTIQVSAGSTTNADGSRTPAYATPQTVLAQIQPLEYNDIMIADGLNIQGVRSKMYVKGPVNGLVRSENKGGDLVTMQDGSVWKVAVISEDWPDWVSCIITLQDGA